MNTCLLLIDPQRSFCDRLKGELYVGDRKRDDVGAARDVVNVTKLLSSCMSLFQSIKVSLDTHNKVHIADGMYWFDPIRSSNPKPFTEITLQSVEDNIWTPTNNQYRDIALNYVRQLSIKSRNKLIIWPTHCELGSEGHNIEPTIAKVLRYWEIFHCKPVDYTLKGLGCYHTEFYSIFQAEVPDESLPQTLFNVRLLEELMQYDEIVAAGEAISHCLGLSIEDADSYTAGEFTKKLILIKDATSPVPGFEEQSDKLVVKLESQGMRTMTTDDFLTYAGRKAA